MESNEKSTGGNLDDPKTNDQFMLSEEQMKDILVGNCKHLVSMMFIRHDRSLAKLYLDKINQNVEDIWKIRNK